MSCEFETGGTGLRLPSLVETAKVLPLDSVINWENHKLYLAMDLRVFEWGVPGPGKFTIFGLSMDHRAGGVCVVRKSWSLNTNSTVQVYKIAA